MSSGKVRSRASFRMRSSVTGAVRAFTGASSTLAQSSFGAVGSGPAVRVTRATPTTCFSSTEW